MAKTSKNNRATNHGYVFPKDDSGKPLIAMKQGIEMEHTFKPEGVLDESLLRDSKFNKPRSTVFNK